jgi:diaminopimelate epimerase
MKIRLDFTKASGAGNDFVIVDNRDESLAVAKPALAHALCLRHEGVGADGLLILGKSVHADFAMEYFNADGSAGAMCGNGGRCIARYAFLHGIAGPKVRFETLGDLYEAEVAGEVVRLRMRDPSAISMLPPLHAEGQEFKGFQVDTGAPHAVFFCDQLEELDVELVGRAIRRSPVLAPAGANIDFVAVQGKSNLSLRTYERGVEAETLACGTGAIASALVAHTEQGSTSPVHVNVRSGEELVVQFKISESSYTDVILQGNATLCYSGSTLYDPISSRISVIR